MLFERLKAETRDLHARIERHLPIFQPDFSMRDYSHLLTLYLGFYTPVEARLEGLRVTGLSMFTEDRRKCPLLIRDLEQLEPNAPPWYAHAEEVPVLGSISQGIGCMYVLEGSTLGGQLISRHLQAKFGITSDRGGTFFASYGENLGQRWTEFRASVNADERAHTEMDEIVASARATFQCFDAWLEQACSPSASTSAL
jgi:heme oxygenase